MILQTIRFQKEYTLAVVLDLSKFSKGLMQETPLSSKESGPTRVEDEF